MIPVKLSTPSYVIGTAGHIDHGKTSLVRALTGIDADRLLEEKQRGITIDIGFAHVEPVPGTVLSFVDLPGHERFIKNMLAGVSGIDMVLFVVAADESVKPQTREHFEICRLLGIQRGVVALTKADLADAELLELVREEVRELVAGSFLEQAPVVPVSAATGAGVPEILAALMLVGRATGRDPKGYFRLPVDRAFSIKGFGTVVTGTMVSGAVEREAEVELYPTGRRLRVRGLQVHGRAVARAEAGQRTALNLAGIEPSQIARGMVLSEPGRFRVSTRLDCELELLPGVKLKPRARVHLHTGALEVQAEIRKLSPVGPARIVLREPALILPGDRFIVRGLSPVTTIGGGVVLAVDPPKKPAPVETVAEAVARTGRAEAELKRGSAEVLFVQPDLLVNRAWLAAQAEKLEAEVLRFHKENPLRTGVPKESLDYRMLDYLLGKSASLVSEGGVVRRREHRIVLRDEEERARGAIEAAVRKGGLAVPGIAEVLAGCGIANARGVLQVLIRDGALVRVSEELVYHREAIAELRQILAGRKGVRFTVVEFKAWTNVSRKFAIPLLEYLDRGKVTRREGDFRVVL